MMQDIPWVIPYAMLQIVPLDVRLKIGHPAPKSSELSMAAIFIEGFFAISSHAQGHHLKLVLHPTSHPYSISKNSRVPILSQIL
jgi:hypothetical protein